MAFSDIDDPLTQKFRAARRRALRTHLPALLKKYDELNCAELALVRYAKDDGIKDVGLCQIILREAIVGVVEEINASIATIKEGDGTP